MAPAERGLGHREGAISPPPSSQDGLQRLFTINALREESMAVEPPHIVMRINLLNILPVAYITLPKTFNCSTSKNKQVLRLQCF